MDGVCKHWLLSVTQFGAATLGLLPLLPSPVPTFSWLQLPHGTRKVSSFGAASPQSSLPLSLPGHLHASPGTQTHHAARRGEAHPKLGVASSPGSPPGSSGRPGGRPWFTPRWVPSCWAPGCSWPRSDVPPGARGSGVPYPCIPGGASTPLLELSLADVPGGANGLGIISQTKGLQQGH